MKLKIFEASLLLGMAFYFFVYNSLFPIPIDIIALIVYSCTWVFKVGSRGYLAARCLYFGIWFAYVLATGMRPSEEQLIILKDYELYNLRFQEVAGGTISHKYPESYLQSVRLIAACDFHNFKNNPPEPITLEIKQ